MVKPDTKCEFLSAETIKNNLKIMFLQNNEENDPYFNPGL